MSKLLNTVIEKMSAISIPTRLPHLNFIRIHYFYFIFTSLLFGTIIWGSSTPSRSVRYIDSLFFAVSAMTEAGLNTVNLSQINTFQQTLLFLLIMLGSSIWVSAWVVGARRRAFHGRFKRHQAERRATEAAMNERVENQRAALSQTGADASNELSRPMFKRTIKWNLSQRGETQGEEEDDSGEMVQIGTRTIGARIGRNSTFHQMDPEERERLSKTEYKAVVFLSWIVPLYFFAWQFLGCLSMGAYVNQYFKDATRENGLNPWWVGAFMCVSAFNNSGMSLLDANMVPFEHSPFVLLSMGLFILAGNTLYPVFLRLFIWTLHKCLPSNKHWIDARCTLQFLLDYPRRCYTNLFPSAHTWWLLGAVVVLNGIDTIMYIILNIGNHAITSTPAGYEFIDGMFQAFSVRSGGFYVVNISSLRIGLQVLYVIMMYISAYPIAITIRNSNVYEERSLGIYADDPYYITWEEHQQRSRKPSLLKVRELKNLFGNGGQSSRAYFVSQQLRAQLAHDLWWLVLAVWLIVIIETSNFDRDPADYSVFNVIFEVVSAYGTVGISVGIPGAAYSFSGAWHTLSKLILCAVMLRGRHRGLPVAIDMAILLPSSDKKDHFEEEDAKIRRLSMSSLGGLPPGLA